MKLIAETAWHHDGDFVFLKKLVKEICENTNTDYIKYHISLDADEYMYHDHPAYLWLKEKMLSEKQWSQILQYTIENGKKLMLLFNDCKSVKFGMKYKPELVEIHSICLNDIKLLNCLNDELKNTNPSVVLGVGGTKLTDIQYAIDFIQSDKIVLMHGFQNYPTKISDINLLKIKKIMSMYPNLEHGYADHTSWDHKDNITTTLLGASLGMKFIEKHVTNVMGSERTDWQAAISIEIFNEIAKKVNVLLEANGDGKLELNDGEKKYSSYGMMKKAGILIKDVIKGELFKVEDIEFKRTAQNSDLSQLDLINCEEKIFSRSISKGSVLNKIDFQ